MNKEYITTVSKETKPSEKVVGSSEEVEGVVGYTLSKSPKKDESGHYVFDSPQEIEPSDADCYAKQTSLSLNDSIRHKYHIKCNLEGRLFDPWGMFSEGTQGSYAKRYGKSQWSFKEVDEKCFSCYLKFLQSRNKAWLTNAEREIR